MIDHYENPRNIGSLDRDDKNVGTGLVGAPACGDVMKLQVRELRETQVGRVLCCVQAFIYRGSVCWEELISCLAVCSWEVMNRVESSEW